MANGKWVAGVGGGRWWVVIPHRARSLFYGPVATAYCFRFASMMATCATGPSFALFSSGTSTTLCCLRAKFLSASLAAS